MSRPPLSLHRALRLALLPLKAAAAFHVTAHYFYNITGAEGASMLPTLDIMGEWVLVSSRHRHGRGVKVGDLVTYDIPVSGEWCGLKRVVGLPGDYVALQAPGTGRGARDDMIQVPQGHCWLVGDNMTVSRDSRDFGPVPLGLVKGKVLATLFPFRWIEPGLTPVE